MPHAIITLKNIHYQIDQRPILEHINLEIYANQILTIVGPNGAGKSSLLALILNHLKPTRGHIYRQPHLKISYLPQRFHVPADLPITAQRFLKDLRPSPDNPWLKRLNLLTLLNKPLQTLSGGETQRLLLARALLRNPQLIVLDEPAAGIDPTTLDQFYKIIRDYQQHNQTSILMVSHDLHLVMAESDRVLCLNKYICCQGSPEDIQKHPEFIQLFGTPAPTHIAFYPHQQHPTA